MKLCISLLFLAFGWCSTVAESHGQSVSQLRIGILAPRGENAAVSRWQPTASYLEQSLDGAPVEVVALSLAGVRAALDRGDLHFLLTNPGHYEVLADSYDLSPVATLRTDRIGSPVTGNRYGAVIFTRSDHPTIRSTSDLPGHVFGAVAPDAFGGFQIAAYTFLQNDIDPWRGFSGIRYFGFPQDRIVEAVVEGEVDFGTVRTGVLENMIGAGRISKDSVRVLNRQTIPDFDLQLSTAVFPEWTFAATPQAGEALRRQVAIALLLLKESDPAAISGRYGGWTPYVHNPSIATVHHVLQDRRADPKASFPTIPVAAFLVAISGFAAFAGLLWRRRRIAPVPADRHDAEAVGHLTRREKEVLSLVQDGYTTKHIARLLKISPKTVEFHRGNLIRKFEARNTAELVHKIHAAR